MSYKEMYKSDKDYQAIINQYKSETNELQRKANYGTYKAEALLKEGADIQSNLANAIKEHNQSKVKEIKESMESLKAHKPVGIAERPDAVKEFELKYKLADDYEIKEMVDNLNSKDLLEISLLRLELKERGLKHEDKAVKRYTMTNQVNGLTDDEQQQYDIRQTELSTYSTMGSNGVVIDEEYKSLDNVQRDLEAIAKTTDAV